MPVDSKQKVSVIGLGYIGLPTAALIARGGAQVVGVDVSAHVVETVNSGRVHIEEVDLDGLVQGVVARGNLRASLSVEASDVFIIAVPTPVAEDRAPDISYVLQAARTVAPVLKNGDTVILESTSPVGTTEAMRDLIAELRPDLRMPAPGVAGDIAIAYCPERVLPGRILVELIDNDRCIGGITPRCARKALGFYRQFVRGACITTTARAAEMVKLVENSFRDVNIAIANELSVIADRMDIDVWEVIRLANRHPRVNILQPGPGVGGHCIAVDPWFIVHGDPENARIIRTAREVNDSKPHWVLNQVKAALADCLTQTGKRASDITIACFGLAFKPNIDDLRESPAVGVAQKIAEWHSGTTWVIEPHIEQLADSLADKAELVSCEQALAQADILVMLVDHRAFRAIDAADVQQNWIVDTKGVWR